MNTIEWIDPDYIHVLEQCSAEGRKRGQCEGGGSEGQGVRVEGVKEKV